MQQASDNLWKQKHKTKTDPESSLGRVGRGCGTLIDTRDSSEVFIFKLLAWLSTFSDASSGRQSLFRLALVDVIGSVLGEKL